MNNNTIITPIHIYYNSDIQKQQICTENKNKSGIYRWTNIVSNKSYIGSSINLSSRLRNYFTISFLENQITNNNSYIYRALLKYGYSNFKLDILEYCDPSIIIKREQYYLDKLNPEYNILKFARSLKGFKHSAITIEKIRKYNLNRRHTEATKLKLSSNIQAQALQVIDINTNEIKVFPSIRRTALFIGIAHTYLAECLNKNNIYIGRGFKVLRKN